MERIRVGALGALAVVAVLAFFLAPSSGLFDRVAVMVLCAVLAIIWNLAVAGGPRQTPSSPIAAARCARAADETSVADTASAATDGRPASSDDADDGGHPACRRAPRRSPLLSFLPAGDGATDAGREPACRATVPHVGGQPRRSTCYRTERLRSRSRRSRPRALQWSPRSTGPGTSTSIQCQPPPAAPSLSPQSQSSRSATGSNDSHASRTSPVLSVAPIEATAAPTRSAGLPDLPVMPAAAGPDEERPPPRSERTGTARAALVLGTGRRTSGVPRRCLPGRSDLSADADAPADGAVRPPRTLMTAVITGAADHQPLRAVIGG